MKTIRTHIYGDVLRKALVGDFTLSETVYPPNLKLPEHSHLEPYFCFVLAGSFTEFSGKQARFCQPRSVMFHPSGQPHSDHFHTGARCFNLQFHNPDRHGSSSRAIAATTPVNSFGGRLAQLATQVYREFRASDKVSNVMIEGLALQMLGLTVRETSAAARVAPTWLIRTREFLRENFVKPPGLAQLGQSAEVHPVYLTREFRRYYGCTVMEYICQLRLDFACDQLANSRASLSEVALAAGFFDQSHFTRTFKAHLGMSPSKYREAFSAR